MIYFLKNKVFRHKLFVVSAFLTCLLYSCSDAENEYTKEAMKRKYYSVNLFPEKTIVNAGKLSIAQARRMSKQVLLATRIEKTSGSETRGVKQFYIYKVHKASFITHDKQNKPTLPLYFLSTENLFEGKVYKDSAFIFLVPLRHYRILQSNLNIKYKWLDQAPF